MILKYWNQHQIRIVHKNYLNLQNFSFLHSEIFCKKHCSFFTWIFTWTSGEKFQLIFICTCIGETIAFYWKHQFSNGHTNNFKTEPLLTWNYVFWHTCNFQWRNQIWSTIGHSEDKLLISFSKSRNEVWPAVIAAIILSNLFSLKNSASWTCNLRSSFDSQWQMKLFHRSVLQNYWEKLMVEITAGLTSFSDEMRILFPEWSISHRMYYTGWNFDIGKPTTSNMWTVDCIRNFDNCQGLAFNLPDR